MPIQRLPHLTPEQTLIRHLLLTNLRFAEPLGAFLGWSTLAIAAVIGIILNDISEIQSLLDLCALKWGLVLLAFSLLFGAFAKQMSEALSFSSKHLIELSDDLFTDGKDLLSNTQLTPELLANELSKCYYWPLSTLVLKSARQGATNFLLSETKFSKLLSIDLFISWAHFFAACAGIVTLAFGIKNG